MDDMEEEGLEREIRTKTSNEGGRRRRRRIGEGSGPPQNPIFVNRAAEEWYAQYRSRKSLTKERALLLFGMISRLPLDVGHIIEASILAAVQGTGNRGWVMPSLITSLCLKNGVVIAEDEVQERPIKSLDHHVYAQMRKDDANDTTLSNPVIRGTARGRRPALLASVERRPRSEDRLKKLEDSVAEVRTTLGTMQARMEEQFSGIADSLRTLQDMVLQLTVVPRVERMESRPSSPPNAPPLATYTRRRRAHSTAPDDEFHTPATSSAGLD